jgi:hypothetical protein
VLLVDAHQGNLIRQEIQREQSLLPGRFLTRAFGRKG